MRTSKDGLNFIKHWEGLVLEAYPDPGTGNEPWTIGYGHTRGVDPGQKIDEYMANLFLESDVIDCEIDLHSCVKVELQSKQHEALVSFVFNIGITAFRDSTLLKKLNSGDYMGASKEFGRWKYSGGQVLLGLVRRREAERCLFVGMDHIEAIRTGESISSI